MLCVGASLSTQLIERRPDRTCNGLRCFERPSKAVTFATAIHAYLRNVTLPPKTTRQRWSEEHSLTMVHGHTKDTKTLALTHADTHKHTHTHCYYRGGDGERCVAREEEG